MTADPVSTNGGWVQYQKLVLAELERNSTTIEKLRVDLTALSQNMHTLITENLASRVRDLEKKLDNQEGGEKVSQKFYAALIAVTVSVVTFLVTRALAK